MLVFHPLQRWPLPISIHFPPDLLNLFQILTPSPFGCEVEMASRGQRPRALVAIFRYFVMQQFLKFVVVPRSYAEGIAKLWVPTVESWSSSRTAAGYQQPSLAVMALYIFFVAFFFSPTSVMVHKIIFGNFKLRHLDAKFLQNHVWFRYVGANSFPLPSLTPSGVKKFPAMGLEPISPLKFFLPVPILFPFSF